MTGLAAGFWDVNPYQLIEQLKHLTATTDVEQVESGLLHTVQMESEAGELYLVRADSDHQIHALKSLEVELKGEQQLDAEFTAQIRPMIIQLDEPAVDYHLCKTTSAYYNCYKCHRSRYQQMYLLLVLPTEPTSQFQQQLLTLLQVFTNYTNLLIESTTDPLTGLLNRKTFDETIDKVYQLVPKKDRIINRERRDEEAAKYWLVMIDIDHFKSINDNFGHLYGDDVLILMAQIIKGNFREEDMIFRFGGEEFVLIIRCQDIAGARVALQRLLNRVESYEFPQVGRVTISAGVVLIDGHTFSATLLDYADKALYHSKDNGRNQVTFYKDMVESGLEQEALLKTGSIDLF